MIKSAIIVRLVLMVVVLGGIGYGLLNCAGVLSNKSVIELEKGVPSVKDAPYVIQTTTRVYYAKSYQDIGGVVTLHDYYEFGQKGWKKQNHSLPMDREYYGSIKVSARQSSQ